ncbi:Glutamine amidotransferase [Microbacterium sp. Nx66]|uniref:glutamine amidotransferase n=1 Tax=Microbacterium sp. Nx66 TaxID=2766784 RepID=UPI001656E434|nr:glutamine amidotransferase [Microbacterium sp. Nx66]CAD5141393.1 Glutamine amidotransferase [Microbacterium sp. Nx66]
MSASRTPRTAIAVRHVPFEDLGILAPLLAARGYETTLLDAGIDAIDPDAVAGTDLLLVLGGPIGVYDEDRYPFLHSSKAALATRLATGGATLGVCLGTQLLAEALGAEVRPTGAVEIGYGPLALTPEGRESVLAPLDGEPVLHWHGDEFAIPAGAHSLAHTPGFPHQAFAVARTLGLQFHLEADHRVIERWLIGHAHELHHHGIDPRTIREQAQRHGPRLEALAIRVLSDWLDEVEA